MAHERGNIQHNNNNTAGCEREASMVIATPQLGVETNALCVTLCQQFLITCALLVLHNSFCPAQLSAAQHGAALHTVYITNIM